MSIFITETRKNSTFLSIFFILFVYCDKIHIKTIFTKENWKKSRNNVILFTIIKYKLKYLT